MASMQRKKALHVACAYGTVSKSAIIVVAGIIPIDLLARERGNKFARTRGRTTRDSSEPWSGF